jgi:hypothetical protein
MGPQEKRLGKFFQFACRLNGTREPETRGNPLIFGARIVRAAELSRFFWGRVCPAGRRRSFEAWRCSLGICRGVCWDRLYAIG